MTCRLRTIATSALLAVVLAGCTHATAPRSDGPDGWADAPTDYAEHGYPEPLPTPVLADPVPVDLQSLDASRRANLVTAQRFMDALARRDAGTLQQMVGDRLDEASSSALPTVLANAESTIDSYTVTAVRSDSAKVVFTVDRCQFQSSVRIFADGTVGAELFVSIDATGPVVLSGLPLNAHTGTIKIPVGVYSYVRGTTDRPEPITVRLPIPTANGTIVWRVPLS